MRMRILERTITSTIALAIAAAVSFAVGPPSETVARPCPCAAAEVRLCTIDEGIAACGALAPAMTGDDDVCWSPTSAPDSRIEANTFWTYPSRKPFVKFPE